MAVDAAYISAISGGEYSVGTTGTISQSTFDLFLAQAVQQATADAPKQYQILLYSTNSLDCRCVIGFLGWIGNLTYRARNSVQM